MFRKIVHASVWLFDWYLRLEWIGKAIAGTGVGLALLTSAGTFLAAVARGITPLTAIFVALLSILLVGVITLIVMEIAGVRTGPKHIHHHNATVQLQGVAARGEVGTFAVTSTESVTNTSLGPTTSLLPDWPIRELFFQLHPDFRCNIIQSEFDDVAGEVLDILSTGRIFADGRIRNGYKHPLTIIPREYWQHAQLNKWLLGDEASGANVLQALPRDHKSPFQQQYGEIQLNRTQCEGVSTPIPLREAARLSFERIEGTSLADAIGVLNQSAEDRLGWFIHSFIIQKLRIYGRMPPSQQLRLIPAGILSRSHPVEGKNELTSDFASENARYFDAAVHPYDLKQFWDGYLTRLKAEDF
jgi:hypothetical protein